MASEDLEKSLRAEVDNYLSGRLNSLQEEVARLHAQVNEAFTRLAERIENGNGGAASITVAVADHLRAAHTRGTEAAAAESRRERASSDVAIIKAAVDDIDNQRTQADILNALVNRAASFAPRIAFFVIKNDRATGWRARGLEGTVGDDAVRDISLPVSADTLLGSAVRTRSVWSGVPGTHTDDHLLLDKLSKPSAEQPQRIVAVPLVARGKAVAVLYADSAGLDSKAVNLEALETMVRVAGMAVELLAVSRPATADVRIAAPPPPFRQQPHAPAAPEPAAATTPSLATETASASSRDYAVTTGSEQENGAEVPVPPAVTEFATPPEETTVSDSTSPAKSPFSFATDAPPTVPVSSPTTDSSTAPAAPAEAATFTSPLGSARRYGGGSDADLPVEVSEEERRLHNDARRFARLLISEIKLYNEQKVQEGRQQGNIYERLREEIDRSRQMYDKRVAPPVAARYDYFHHELVNTLAEGNQEKLGESYPGAVVLA